MFGEDPFTDSFVEIKVEERMKMSATQKVLHPQKNIFHEVVVLFLFASLVLLVPTILGTL